MTHLVVADRTSPGIDGELTLVERARDGDRHAFDRLVAARLPQTYRLAKAITGHPGDAEDVTQEAFLQAWRNLPRLRELQRVQPHRQRNIAAHKTGRHSLRFAEYFNAAEAGQ